MPESQPPTPPEKVKIKIQDLPKRLSHRTDLKNSRKIVLDRTWNLWTEQLSTALSSLPDRNRFAFAAVCAERLVPIYEDACSWVKFPNNAPRRTLDTIWKIIQGRNLPRPDLAEMESIRAEFEAETPNIERENTVVLQIANFLYVCNVIDRLLTAMETGKAEAIVDAGRSTPEFLEAFIHERDYESSKEWASAEAVERTFYDPLCIQERFDQEHLIRELAAVGDIDEKVIKNSVEKATLTAFRLADLLNTEPQAPFRSLRWDLNPYREAQTKRLLFKLTANQCACFVAWCCERAAPLYQAYCRETTTHEGRLFQILESLWCRALTGSSISDETCNALGEMQMNIDEKQSYGPFAKHALAAFGEAVSASRADVTPTILRISAHLYECVRYRIIRRSQVDTGSPDSWKLILRHPLYLLEASTQLSTLQTYITASSLSVEYFRANGKSNQLSAE